MEASGQATRGDLRQWAAGLDDADLHRLALSFLSRLAASTAPDEWQDRRQMREILAALFMEWGKRDIDGVQSSLKDIGGLMADLAHPTALAGLSEIRPHEALDRLNQWEVNEDSTMSQPAIEIALFHLAKLDPDEAFERVKNGDGEMEGLAAAFTEDPQRRSSVLKWMDEWLDTRNDLNFPATPFGNPHSTYGRWRVEFARGWARHDLPAAWNHLSQAKEFTEGDIITLPEWEFWESVGVARPEAAMDFVMEHLAGRRDESERFVNSVDAAFHGALKSDPDTALTRMLRESPSLEEGWASFILSESGATSRENESAAWPIDPVDLLPLPLSARNERILSRLHEFGLGQDEEDKVKKRLKSE